MKEFLIHAEVWNSETESTEVIEDVVIGTDEHNARAYVEHNLEDQYPDDSQLLELTLTEVEPGTAR